MLFRSGQLHVEQRHAGDDHEEQVGDQEGTWGRDSTLSLGPRTRQPSVIPASAPPSTNVPGSTAVTLFRSSPQAGGWASRLCAWPPLSPHPDTSLWAPRSPRPPGTCRPRSRADQPGSGAALLLTAVCSPPGRPWVPSLSSMGMSVLVSHGSLGSNAAWPPGSQPASVGLRQSSLLAGAAAGLGSLQATAL